MSKSATEQYQIKKKRKFHKNSISDHNKNNNNNNTKNNIQNINHKINYKNLINLNDKDIIKLFQTEHNFYNLNKLNSLKFINLLNCDENFCTFSLLNNPLNYNNNNNNKSDLIKINKMPLSQGYFAKGASSISSKRGLKPLKICIHDDCNYHKRKINENHHYYQHQHQNQNQNHYYNHHQHHNQGKYYQQKDCSNVNCNSNNNNNNNSNTNNNNNNNNSNTNNNNNNSNTNNNNINSNNNNSNNNNSNTSNNNNNSVNGKPVLSPLTSFTSQSFTHQLLSNNNNNNNNSNNNNSNHNVNNININNNTNNNNNNNNSKQSSQLQLLCNYLFGESLACCGRLQEAFDVYSRIASEQLNGHIPLERLNILASSLIQYMRQMHYNINTRTDNLVNLKSSSYPNDIIVKESTDCCYDEPPMKQKCLTANTNTNTNANANQTPHLKTDPHLNINKSAFGPVTTTPAAYNDFKITIDNDYDPLLCTLCRDILRCPVTTNCGHTFCKTCCETITSCNICLIKFPKLQLDEIIKDTTSTTITTTATTTTLTSSSPAAGTVTGSAFLMDLNEATSGPTLNYPLSPNHFNQMPMNNPNDQHHYLENDNHHLNMNESNQMIVANMTDYIMPVAQQTAALRLVNNTITSPVTVTTTTVASTTSTATTTMASSSSSAAASAAASASALSSSSVAAVAASPSSSASLATTTTSSALPYSQLIKSESTRCLSNNDKMKFMPDVLVRRLVEKWWGNDLQAKKINEAAASYMHLNLLDQALKFCNASLEKSPTNYKSLLLRAEVLFKMNHYQSCLADVENALKSCFNSSKAYYIRALALSEVGRLDEALYSECLAICLDKTTNLSNSEIFQHDLAKILQKFISQKSKLRNDLTRAFLSKTPYCLSPEHRLRRKKMALFNTNTEETISVVFEDDDQFVKQQYEYMSLGEEEADLLVDSLDYVDCHDHHAFNDEKRRPKEYEILLRRHASRKHFRRKWLNKDTAIISNNGVQEPRCSSIFRNIVEKTEQELQRLKQLIANGETHLKKLVHVPSNLIDASEFDCVLCSRTLWKPVVTPCGHTYCMVCLDRCIDYKFPCPLCMSPLVESSVNFQQGSSSPVPFVLAKRPVTKFLEAAMKRFIPKSYEKRFRQEIEMEPSVPVFICTTAFPSVPCPLFVCEPRYRLMVRRAVESGEKQFGIVQPHSGKTRYFDVGTILDIRDCVMLGNGCSILSTIGCKRFKILARNEKDGYETAKVEYIHDEPITEENKQFVRTMHDVVFRKAIEWYASLSVEKQQEIQQTFGEMPLVEDNWETNADGPAWAWWIIALLPLHPQLKVVILATTSLEKRLRAIEKTLDHLPDNFRHKNQSKCDVAAETNPSNTYVQNESLTEEELQLQDEAGSGDTMRLHNSQSPAIQTDDAQHQFDGTEEDMMSQNIECCQRSDDTVDIRDGMSPERSTNQRSMVSVTSGASLSRRNDRSSQSHFMF